MILAGAAATPAPAAKQRAASLYVRAGAEAGGDGSRRHPFDSLARVEQASRARDTIIVLRSGADAPPLDGGIALKPRQRLIGAGPRVTSRRARGAVPAITNRDLARLEGDAVRLADGATVRNIRVVDPLRGGIYGEDVGGVKVIGNDISSHNGSCAEGFHIPAFVAPSNVPGAGLPISDGLINGWAAIMLDAARGRGRARISRNRVHDGHCGDGIDVRLSGDARYRVEIRRNRVHDLEEGSTHQSLLAIGLQTRDGSRLRANLVGNRQTRLGNPDDPNTLFAGADSEGIFVNPVGPSRLDVRVIRNIYANPPGLGGFSANGMEMVSMGDGSVAKMVIRDSTFTGSTGDLLEEGGLGTNADLSLSLVDVVVAESSGFGNTGVLPFNNGDCLLAGSLGAGNTIRLSLLRTTLTNCANNGLSVGSNVVNGSGPTKRIEVAVADSEITGNRGANVGIRNFTGLERLAIRIENTDLSGSHGAGSGFANVEAEELGTTAEAGIDLGGGPLGSAGGNCITERSPAASALGYEVHAAGNWWGQPSGPNPGTVLGSVTVEPFLTAPPPSC